ncbi:MAG: flavodoxin-dependent (E)-4-hydroxy-3-methylbut-2-enyl-diphosphate synthase [Deltaproteobacteria bacterium]|nr:flavodoxin-dependent (E)-4-hydroxy-3-methylbut-2-enyl-diphosphate synthase [Deltaproteobacteria bacterium]
MRFEIKRKKTECVNIGGVKIGDMAPIAVQSMTNTKTSDIEKTVSQIKKLQKAGCEIIRVAVPDKASANAISLIKKQISIPLIADIHFDFRLAIDAAKAGADALRINPGNIGSAEKVEKVINCAKEKGISIRIGVNAGSMEKDIIKKYGGATPEAMVESALRHIELLAKMNFYNIKISVKASDILRTVKAYRLFSEKSALPVHLGITEAGPLFPGLVKSSLGIGMLLAEGIGDTIRVSLTTKDITDEIRAGYEILKALDIRRRNPEIISCPTCGRCQIDLFKIVEKVEKKICLMEKDIKTAIMGCVVNGPGEAKEADIGIAGGDGIGIIFKKGKVIKKCGYNDIVETLLKEIDKL